jgi:hypothetical protein
MAAKPVARGFLGRNKWTARKPPKIASPKDGRIACPPISDKPVGGIPPK